LVRYKNYATVFAAITARKNYVYVTARMFVVYNFGLMFKNLNKSP